MHKLYYLWLYMHTVEVNMATYLVIIYTVVNCCLNEYLSLWDVIFLCRDTAGREVFIAMAYCKGANVCT